MSVIDDYLKKIEPAKRSALKRIRSLAKAAVPSAEEAISYGMPTLTYRGKAFLGFDARTSHIGIYPHSGRVIPALKDQLRGYKSSAGAVQVPLDAPIPAALLKKIIDLRLKAIRAEAKTKRRP